MLSKSNNFISTFIKIWYTVKSRALARITIQGIKSSGGCYKRSQSRSQSGSKSRSQSGSKSGSKSGSQSEFLPTSFMDGRGLVKKDSKRERRMIFYAMQYLPNHIQGMLLFGRSNTLIPTGEGRLFPPITTGPPNVFHIPASMNYVMYARLRRRRRAWNKRRAYNIWQKE